MTAPVTIDMLQRACSITDQIMSSVRPEQLAAPTPCRPCVLKPRWLEPQQPASDASVWSGVEQRDAVAYPEHAAHVGGLGPNREVLHEVKRQFRRLQQAVNEQGLEPSFGGWSIDMARTLTLWPHVAVAPAA